ncbi:histidine kinase dimerization/phosphoacceptor domain -containing protein [Fodinibius halophilus]|uniref:histidine kinase n=1 Tax=Fodinibius halophilus TaxID=1736908 RepID=A0A6M1TIL0_9BACT|nr:histidine kinase dimerization/phosphoacceptor domain -containing protein [Fodinibius halophilus]NGP88440.1 HAMP domain-containing protein [Fodinibius halophilus]
MKLSTKLFISFSVVIILVGGIGITSSYINEAVKDQVTAESAQAIDEIELAGELGLQLYQSLTRTQYLLEDQYRKSLSMSFSRGNKTRETLVADIDESLNKFRQTIRKTRKRIKEEPSNIFEDSVPSEEGLAVLNKLEKKFNIYSSLIEQLQNIDPENYKDQKEFFTVTIEPYFRSNLLPLIEKGRKKIQNNHQQEITSINSQLDRIGYILSVATIVAIVIAIILTFFLYRSIANPIKKIAAAAKSIGQGNLHERIDYSSKDELGELSETFDHMAESLSQTTVSRDYVDSIIEAMADLLVVTDAEYNITRVNSAGVAMLGSTEEKLLNEPVQNIFKSSVPDLFEENATNSSKGNDAVLLASDDSASSIPVSVSKGMIKSSKNTIKGYVIVASDISAEKEAQQKITRSLQEKEVLLAEIHHRVKNNLAVISGLLQMQIWDTENDYAVSALQQSQMRVRSIALVHENLYQSESLSYIEFDSFTEDLLESIKDSYLDDDITINTDIDNIVLTVSQAIPCSLIINELIFNAFKDGNEAAISLQMKKQKEEIYFIIKDDGIGIKEEDLDSDSLRISLLQVLANQLNGRLNIHKDNGIAIEICFVPEEIDPEHSNTLHFG